MGFFDKVKGFFGGGDAKTKLEVRWIEDPFPFQDPLHKGTILVTAEAGSITVKSYRARFIAIVKDSEGNEEELELSVDDSTEANWAGDEFPAKPHKLNKGESMDFGFFIDNLNLTESLSKYGIKDAASANLKGAKFKIKVSVDIAETNFMFDPDIEHFIKVIDKN